MVLRGHRPWRRAGLTRPWNDQDDDLRRAVEAPASDVLIGVAAGRLVAVVMVGHDGHRGWVYYLAVDPGSRGSGFGRAMMTAAETWLREREVPKLNLMVRGENERAVSFYQALGYTADDVAVLSRRLDDGAIVIRAGRDGDAELLLELFDGAVAWLVSRGQTGQWGSEPFSGTPRGVAKITDLAAEEGLRAAEIDGRGVGAIVTGSAPGYVLPASVTELYVLGLVSSRAHAGRGIGARLIDYAREEARQMGCQQLRVDCWAGSPSLIGFYESVGFTKLDTFEVGGWSGQVLSMPVQGSPACRRSSPPVGAR
ncbi:MAG: GNAT family acetyltransferase [Solirubrobacteraceae bacterium]